MTTWIEGRPASPGIYWVVWEDHSGRPSSCLCVVQMRPANDAPPLPRFEAGDDLALYIGACNEWHAAHLQLMYRAAENDPGEWQPVSWMGWRVTHHQPIQRPDPSRDATTDPVKDDPTGLLRLSAACYASSPAQWARAMGGLLLELHAIKPGRDLRAGGGIAVLQDGGVGARDAIGGVNQEWAERMVQAPAGEDDTGLAVVSALAALLSRPRAALRPDQGDPLLKMQNAVEAARQAAHDAKIAAAMKTATQAALRAAQAAGVDARAVFQEAWRLA